MVVQTRSRRFATSVLLGILAVASADAAAPQSRLANRRSGGSADYRLRTARVVANALPLTASFLERQREDGFNTILLNDVIGWDGGSGQWVRQSDASIVEQMALVRSYDFSVFVCIAAVLPPAPDPRGRTRAARKVVPFAPGLSPTTSMEGDPVALHAGWTLLDATDLQARIHLWTEASQGELIGILFAPDDLFLLRVPVAAQHQWRSAARTVDPLLPVLGMVGEFGLAGDAGSVAPYWDPDAFDALIWLNYPYNLSRSWTRALDHSATNDADGDLTLYERDYSSRMQARFFRELSKTQWIIPVIQTFSYRGERAGAIPRVRDIELQAQLVREAVRHTFHQPDNLTLGYFFTGSAEPGAEIEGIYDRAEWSMAVASENQRLEQWRLMGHRIGFLDFDPESLTRDDGH